MSTDLRKEIAKITRADIEWESHGFLVVDLEFSYGNGAFQGLPGWPLTGYSVYYNKQIGTAAGMNLIIAIMSACGVSKWSEVEGRTVYVLTDGLIRGLEPLPTEKGKRFVFSSVMSEFE